jgi:hypothetical protein
MFLNQLKKIFAWTKKQVEFSEDFHKINNKKQESLSKIMHIKNTRKGINGK